MRADLDTNGAWEALFEKYGILAEIDAKGVFRISARRIREFREPRLMAKFDHSVNLPEIFAGNGLAILPVSRGSYVIGRFAAYHPLGEPDPAVAVRSLPPHLETLSAGCITSEATALSCALASGIIADFLGDGAVPTVSGRMGSGEFAFSIRDVRTRGRIPLRVENAQIEIDAGYECADSLAIVEAKCDLADDFLVRQLYYPFRTWRDRIRKRVRTVFLIHSNGMFHLREYAFPRPDEYDSPELVRRRTYLLEDTRIGPEDIRGVLAATPEGSEPAAPFPQADSFERVVNLCELLAGGALTPEEVTANYAFDRRQAGYYANAAIYLGLVGRRTEDGRSSWFLSEAGRRILGMGFRSRRLALCGEILRRGVFRDAFSACLSSGRPPSDEEIVAIMRRREIGLNDTTCARRASTVRSWLGWMFRLRDGA